MRDIVAIVESFERALRAMPELQSQLFTSEEGANVYTRIEALMKPTGLIGLAESATISASYSGQSASLLIVDYEALVTSPERTIAAVYAFLGLEAPRHDFNNIEPIEHAAYDARIGLPDLHKVRPVARKQAHPSILPPDLIAKLSGREFWRQQSTLDQGLSIVTTPKPAA